MASAFKRDGRRCYTAKFSVRGKHKTCRGYADEQATYQLAVNIERLAAKRAIGEPIRGELLEWLNGLERRLRRKLADLKLIPDALEAKDKPLKDHLADWVADLKATGRDGMYAYNCDHRTAKLVDECGWHDLADVQPESFSRWRSKQTKKAPRTLAQYHETLRAFLNWCVAEKRLPENPLLELKAVDWRGQEKRKRRALTLAEVDALLTKAGKRALCYKVALYCQLRRADVRALRWGDVHLDTLPAYLMTTAATAKAKRDTRHPLRADLADELRAVKPADAKPSEPVFPRPPGIKQFRADLRAAKVDYVDDRGRQADFHAFGRVTPNTMMANAGVPIRVAMSLMRHTDPKLTTGPYTDADALAKAQAVEMLPTVGQGRHLQTASAVLKMEGTTGGPVENGTTSGTTTSAERGVPVAAVGRETDGEPQKGGKQRRDEKAHKQGRLATLGSKRQRVADATRLEGISGPLGLEPSENQSQSLANTALAENRQGVGTTSGTTILKSLSGNHLQRQQIEAECDKATDDGALSRVIEAWPLMRPSVQLAILVLAREAMAGGRG